MTKEEPSDNMMALLKELYSIYEWDLNVTMAYHIKNSSDGQVILVEADSEAEVEILSFCGITQNFEFWQTWENFVFWFEGVLILLVGFIGLLSNTLTAYILSSSDFREMQWSTFNYLLIGLSVFDLLFLTFSVPVHVFPIPGMTWLNAVHNTRHYCIIYRFVLYPFSSVTYTAGVFITVAMTIERFQAVCFPHYYRNSLITSTPLKRALKFIITAIVAAFVLEIQKFFEVKVHEEEDGTTTCVASALTTDAIFVDWIKMSSIFHPFLTTTFIPIIILFIMNTCIYRGIKANRRRLSISQTTLHSQTQQSDHKLQAVLITLCTVFVITHFPRLVLAFLAFVRRPKATHCASYNIHYIPELYIVCMETVSNLLIHVHASFTLLIFSCTSTQFKEVFHLKFPRLFGSSSSNNVAHNAAPKLEEAAPVEVSCANKEHQGLLKATTPHSKALSKSHLMVKAVSSSVLYTEYAQTRKRFLSLSDLSQLQMLANIEEKLPSKSANSTPTGSQDIQFI